MPDLSFLFAQALSGFTTAMFLFLIAAGLSLIFGVLRVLNFAHGSFYMLGAYLAYQVVHWASGAPGWFWGAALGAGGGIALFGGLVERLLLHHLYRREELYQLLFTYALVLILSDAAKVVWGTGQLSVSRPPALTGAVRLFGTYLPYYNLDREMLGALGVNVNRLYTGVFVLGSFLAGLGGALVTPVKTVVPGMDVEIIVEAFIVVVIGGLGSFWGTFLGAIIYGQVLSFGILIFPRFSIFSVFALMAVVLILRPWGLLGRPVKV
jgi:branched-chain amino acid transport system permease protein